MRRFCLFLVVLNSVFFALNLFFMFLVPEPTVNFLCALVSLAGVYSAWTVYNRTE